MKLTMKKLTEMVDETLKEISGTGGGTAHQARRNAAAHNTDIKRGAEKKHYITKTAAEADARRTKTSWDAAKANVKRASQTLSDLNSKKYRQPGRVRGTYIYRSVPTRGFTLNPEWTTANDALGDALTDQSTAETTYTTAERNRVNKTRDYNTAADNLSDAERDEKATKKDTSFAFSAGGGGRGAGKGGVAKSRGKGKGKGKGKKGNKDESLFRVLGRDFLNELNNLKKYKL